MILNILHDVAHRFDVFDFFIRNFHIEFLFQGHHQVNDIQGVSAQVIGDGSLHRDLFRIHIQLIAQNFRYFFQYHNKILLQIQKTFFMSKVSLCTIHNMTNRQYCQVLYSTNSPILRNFW